MSAHKYKQRSESGFSLIELLVVLSILTLALGLLPAGFERLYAKSEIDNLSQEISANLRECALKARQVGHQLSVGFDVSSDCRLPQYPSVSISFGQALPTFYADGSSNGQTLKLRSKESQLSIAIDRLTSNIKILADAS